MTLGVPEGAIIRVATAFDIRLTTRSVLSLFCGGLTVPIAVPCYRGTRHGKKNPAALNKSAIVAEHRCARRSTTDGQRMSYSLAAAAKATGLNKRAIREAIKGGKLVATRDELGQWRVEAAELHRVYPAVERRSAGGDAAQPPAAPDDSAVGPQVDAIIRRAEERLRQQLDDVRRDQARRGPAQAPPGAAHRASAGGT